MRAGHNSSLNDKADKILQAEAGGGAVRGLRTAIGDLALSSMPSTQVEGENKTSAPGGGAEKVEQTNP